MMKRINRERRQKGTSVAAATAICLLTSVAAVTQSPQPVVSYQSALVQARTEDNVVLDGALWTPSEQTSDTGVILIHGSFREFYEDRPMAERFAGHGFRTLAMNQRDHGFFAGLRLFDASARDIRYAVDLLMQRGCERVVLVGHSWGSVLVAGYLAAIQDRRVAAAVLLAPLDDVRLQAATVMGSQAAYDEAVRTAQRMVSDGRGREAFLLSSSPLSLHSYEVFLDKRGPQSRAVAPELLKSVKAVPILAIKDPADPQGGRLADAKQRFEAANANLRFVVLLDTRSGRLDQQVHDFVGRENEVFGIIQAWLLEHKIATQ